MDVLGDTLESVKPLPTGVREGEYYLCPRDTKRPCVIDPAPYDMGGKMVMLASFNRSSISLLASSLNLSMRTYGDVIVVGSTLLGRKVVATPVASELAVSDTVDM